jgi:hypothetical protein
MEGYPDISQAKQQQQQLQQQQPAAAGAAYHAVPAAPAAATPCSGSLAPGSHPRGSAARSGGLPASLSKLLPGGGRVGSPADGEAQRSPRPRPLRCAAQRSCVHHKQGLHACGCLPAAQQVVAWSRLLGRLMKARWVGPPPPSAHCCWPALGSFALQQPASERASSRLLARSRSKVYTPDVYCTALHCTQTM